MTPRTVRFLPFAAVAAVVWLIGGHTPTTAQAPPAAGGTDKRLEAMEDKLNRLVSKIDPPKYVADKETLTKTLDLFKNAREVLKGELEQNEKQYSEFRRANPFLDHRRANGSSNIYVERIVRLETEAADTRRKAREIDVQKATVKRCLAAGKDDAAALVLLLKRRGIDLTKMPGLAENDFVEQLKVYLRSLELETEEQGALATLAEDAFNKAQIAAREISSYEAEDEKYRARITANRQLFDNIVKRLQEIRILHDGN